MVWYGEEMVVFIEGDSGMDGRVEGWKGGRMEGWKEWRRRKEGGRREEEGRMGGRVGRTDGTGVVGWMCSILYNNCIRRCIHRTDDCDAAMSGRGGAAETVCGIFVLEKCSRALGARIWLGR